MTDDIRFQFPSVDESLDYAKLSIIVYEVKKMHGDNNLKKKKDVCVFRFGFVQYRIYILFDEQSKTEIESVNLVLIILFFCKTVLLLL